MKFKMNKKLSAILSVLLGLLICAVIVIATMGVKKTQTKELLMKLKNNVNVKKSNVEHTGQTEKYDPVVVVSAGRGGGGGGGFSGGGGFGGGGGGFGGSSGGHSF